MKSLHLFLHHPSTQKTWTYVPSLSSSFGKHQQNVTLAPIQKAGQMENIVILPLSIAKESRSSNVSEVFSFSTFVCLCPRCKHQPRWLVNSCSTITCCHSQYQIQQLSDSQISDSCGMCSLPYPHYHKNPQEFSSLAKMRVSGHTTHISWEVVVYSALALASSHAHKVAQELSQSWLVNYSWAKESTICYIHSKVTNSNSTHQHWNPHCLYCTGS
jgi:hypothetical protein